jgi:hypothetical protein
VVVEKVTRPWAHAIVLFEDVFALEGRQLSNTLAVSKESKEITLKWVAKIAGF